MTDADTFAIQTATIGDALVLAVRGEVDLTSAPELGAGIELVSADTGRVIVDLTAVSFFDSSGLNTLISGEQELRRRGIELRVVVAPGSPVRRVFEITQLIEPLSVVASLDEAL